MGAQGAGMLLEDGQWRGSRNLLQGGRHIATSLESTGQVVLEPSTREVTFSTTIGVDEGRNVLL